MRVFFFLNTVVVQIGMNCEILGMHGYVSLYVYMCLCVCVCVCVWMEGEREVRTEIVLMCTVYYAWLGNAQPIDCFFCFFTFLNVLK